MMLRITTLLLALLMPVAANAEWHEASTAHFVVYADAPADRVAKFATDLEKFEKVMRFFYPNALPPVESPANRVKVFVVSNRGRIGKLAGSSMIAGFYISRAGGSVAFVPRVSERVGNDNPFAVSGASVLRHEYAHHFMFSSFNSAAPRWYSEGFAEYWSTLTFDKEGTAIVGAVPKDRVYWLVTTNPIPVAELLTMTNRKLNSVEREAIYGRGWLLTHYLMSDVGRQKQLAAYIAAINRGEPLDQAARAFGDLKALSKALDAHKNARRLTSFHIPPDRIEAVPAKVRKLTPGEAATMDVRIESNAGVTKEEAKIVVVDARKAAAPYPDDPGAQVALAEAEYDTGNYALADAAAGRALAANPKMGDALYYRAMSRLALAEADKGEKPDWTGARNAIVAANHADPDDPRPLMLYFRSFQSAGDTPPPSAKAGLLKALTLAPSDYDLRWQAAWMLVGDDRRKDARNVLRPIAFHPHGGKGAEQARTMIAALDRGDSSAKVLAAGRSGAAVDADSEDD